MTQSNTTALKVETHQANHTALPLSAQPLLPVWLGVISSYIWAVKDSMGAQHKENSENEQAT